EGEVELVTERDVRFLAVRAHAQDHSVLLLDSRVVVAEATGLARAARGVVLGVEVEDNLLAAEVAQLDLLALVIDPLKVRSFLTYLNRCHLGIPCSAICETLGFYSAALPVPRTVAAMPARRQPATSATS